MPISKRTTTWRWPGLLTMALPAVLLAVVAIGLTGCRTNDAAEENCPEKPLVETGTRLGELTLTNSEGQPVSFNETIDGKVALVDVWATWCQPCLIALPHLQKLHMRYKDDGFTVVGIMIDGNATDLGPTFVQEKAIQYPSFFDDDGTNTICGLGDFYTVPFLMLVDRDGTVIETYQGVGDVTAIDRKLEEIFGEPVETTTVL